MTFGGAAAAKKPSEDFEARVREVEERKKQTEEALERAEKRDQQRDKGEAAAAAVPITA